MQPEKKVRRLLGDTVEEIKTIINNSNKLPVAIYKKKFPSQQGLEQGEAYSSITTADGKTYKLITHYESNEEEGKQVIRETNAFIKRKASQTSGEKLKSKLLLGEGSTSWVGIVEHDGKYFAIKKLNDPSHKNVQELQEKIAKESKVIEIIKLLNIHHVTLPEKIVMSSIKPPENFPSFHAKPYYIMPLVNCDGNKFIKKYMEGTNTVTRIESALAAAKNLLLSLKEMHAVGIYHRDIKPGNILYDEKDGTFSLTDWGTATIYTDEHMGIKSDLNINLTLDPNYYMPEIDDRAAYDEGSVVQIDGKEILHGEAIDSDLDLWQVGLTLLQLVLGLTTKESTANFLSNVRDKENDANRKGIVDFEVPFPHVLCLPDYEWHTQKDVRYKKEFFIGMFANIRGALEAKVQQELKDNASFGKAFEYKGDAKRIEDIVDIIFGLLKPLDKGRLSIKEAYNQAEKLWKAGATNKVKAEQNLLNEVDKEKKTNDSEIETEAKDEIAIDQNLQEEANAKTVNKDEQIENKTTVELSTNQNLSKEPDAETVTSKLLTSSSYTKINAKMLSFSEKVSSNKQNPLQSENKVEELSIKEKIENILTAPEIPSEEIRDMEGIKKAKLMKIIKLLELPILSTPEAIVKSELSNPRSKLSTSEASSIKPLEEIGNGDYLITNYLKTEEDPDTKRQMILDISTKLLKDLKAMHDAGLYHRDLKPSNILYSTDANGKIDVSITDVSTASLHFENKGIKTRFCVSDEMDARYFPPEFNYEAIPIEELDSLTDGWHMGLTLLQFAMALTTKEITTEEKNLPEISLYLKNAQWHRDKQIEEKAEYFTNIFEKIKTNLENSELFNKKNEQGKILLEIIFGLLNPGHSQNKRLTVEEAYNQLQKYLSDANMTNNKTVPLTKIELPGEPERRNQEIPCISISLTSKASSLPSIAPENKQRSDQTHGRHFGLYEISFPFLDNKIKMREEWIAPSDSYERNKNKPHFEIQEKEINYYAPNNTSTNPYKVSPEQEEKIIERIIELAIAQFHPHTVADLKISGKPDQLVTKALSILAEKLDMQKRVCGENTTTTSNSDVIDISSPSP